MCFTMWHNRQYFHIETAMLSVEKKILQAFHILARVEYCHQNKNAQNVLEVSPCLIFNIHQSLLSLYRFYYRKS